MDSPPVLPPSGRRARKGMLSGGGLAILAAALAAANLLSQRLFVRWDWTAGGRYSLSAASRKLVRSLEDPVILKAYISDGLPQPYGAQAQYLLDLLGEYRAASRGKVRVEVVVPEKSEKLKQEASQAGIPPARFTQMASDQFQIREGFLGIVVYYQDKNETIPFVKNVDGLEYELSSRIKKLARPGTKVLGFVTGHREKFPDEVLQDADGRLLEGFTVQSVQLSTSSQRPDLLFIVGPQTPYTPEEIAVLDRYLAEGVPAAVFLNTRTVGLQSFASFPLTTGLEPLLAHYGVRVGGDFVLDAQCQQVTVQTRQGGFMLANIISYPAFPLVRPGADHPLTKSLDILGFPFVHPLTLTVSSGSGLKAEVLARSSPHSWSPPNLTVLDPYRLPPAGDADLRGPFDLAVAVEGSTTSFTDPSRPASVRLAVFGTHYMADPSMPIPPANRAFLNILAEWLVQDPDLLAIPSKDSPFRPLRPLPAAARWFFKMCGYFLLPLLVVAAAFVRWRRRQASRGSIQKEWEASRA